MKRCDQSSSSVARTTQHLGLHFEWIDLRSILTDDHFRFASTSVWVGQSEEPARDEINHAMTLGLLVARPIITRKLRSMTMLLKILLLKISLGLGFGLVILALL